MIQLGQPRSSQPQRHGTATKRSTSMPPPISTWPAMEAGRSGYGTIPISLVLPGVPQGWNAMPQNVPQSAWPMPNANLNTGSGASSSLDPGVLEVKEWFTRLENHPTRNENGLKFSEYGTILANEGFRRITQLSRKFIAIAELREWLNISSGTAVAIFEYAEEDVRRYEAAGGVLYD
jgi:hypothetical protein